MNVNNKKQATRQLPKTPKHHFLKHLNGLRNDILNYQIQKTAELGDTFHLDLAVVQLVISSNPDFVKEVLQVNYKNYKKSFADGTIKMGLGEGLSTSDGDFWRKQRRLMQPIFYKKNLADIFNRMSQTIQEFISQLENQRGQSVDFSHEFSKITAQIVLRSLFNIENIDRLDAMYHSIGSIQEYLMRHIKNPIFSPFLRLTKAHQNFKKEIQELDDWIYDIIHKRRASGKRKADLLQMLMDAQDAYTGEKMTDLQLRDELITIFATGHETTAIALSCVFYLLAKHKDILQKVKKELNSILPHHQIPTIEDLKKLQYTNQVISETLRLYAPTWMIGRSAIEDDVINGYSIKKGQDVILQLYIMHRSPDLWEAPDVFNPDRFAPELVQKRPKHHFLPFGTGPRICIGNHFAMMEMQLMLAMLLPRFDFNLIGDYELEIDPLITLRPKEAIILNVI